jgi:hypothetical protein
MDSFCKSMDLYRIVTTNPDSKRVRFVPYDMNPGFISYCGSRIRTWKDLYCIVHTNPANFQKIRFVFTNPMNPHESSWILTNPHKSSQILVHRCILNKYEPIWILCFWFANPYGIQKICIVDSLRRPVFIRFVLWIRFVYLFSKDLYCGFD